MKINNLNGVKFTGMGKKSYIDYLLNLTPKKLIKTEKTVLAVEKRQEGNLVPIRLIARNMFRVEDKLFPPKPFSTFLGRLKKAEREAVLKLAEKA